MKIIIIIIIIIIISIYLVLLIAHSLKTLYNTGNAETKKN